MCWKSIIRVKNWNYTNNVFVRLVFLYVLLNLACPNGVFGRKCLETCGNCLGDETCYNVDGMCMDGCNEGFKGDLCKTG